VVVRKHAVVGAGSIILPGVTIGLAASVGALTLVKKDVPDFEIVAGNPMRTLGKRDSVILENEARFMASLSHSQPRESKQST
jgi:galactoside O-acetyltransferase